MPNPVTLAEIKDHVSAPLSGADDSQLQGYLDAAGVWVEAYLRRDLDTDFPDGWPPPVGMAIMLMVAHWYDNRGAAGEDMTEIAFGARKMLNPYRDLS